MKKKNWGDGGLHSGLQIHSKCRSGKATVAQEAERFIYQLQHWWFFSHPM